MLPIAPDTLLQQRYRVLNMLGEGRFGRTYLAVDRGRADAFCAIEELAPFSQYSSAVATAKAIFKQEATLLYQLQHPQVPRFWTTFEEQNRLLLVRDYIPGKTYRELLDERSDLGRTFSADEVWQFLVELTPVLGYIHSKGTIHRDISPEHIICRDDDRLPVPIDFGIVKEFANKLQVSPDSPRIAVGRPGYAPIEQLETGEVSPHGDLYALAVTAIVLLTGKEASALFIGDRVNWDWRKWTDIDDDFANILGRMLSPDPNDRYQSALAVEHDLQALDLASNQQFEPEPSPFNPLAPAATVAAGDKNTFSVGNRFQSAITNLNVKSIWEKPQVFIPAGVLISLLAGVGSWFGVTQLLHRQPDPVASIPPKQIEFNNPTIATDTSTTPPTTGDTIRPEMDRAIEKEGKVDANTPVRYKIAAIAGENLDIQLVPLNTPTADPSKITLPIDPAAPISPKAPQSKDLKSKTTIPVAVATPAPTQVLMTIISPTGGPIDDKADRVLSWRGQLSTSGDYTIELRPIAGLAGGTFPYKLSVTQLSVSPATAPVNISPNPAGANPQVGAPIPINGNTGLKAIPTDPTTTIPSNSLPTFTPVPVPIEVPKATPHSTPTEPERPTRNRKRNQTPAAPSPQVKRERVESSDPETPTPRRNRNRQTKVEIQPQPSSTPKPDLGDNTTTTPSKQEEQIPIIVPDAKNTTPVPTKTPAPTKTEIDRKDSPVNSSVNDPD